MWRMMRCVNAAWRRLPQLTHYAEASKPGEASPWLEMKPTPKSQTDLAGCKEMRKLLSALPDLGKKGLASKTKTA